jgi:hypothetical protein
MKEINYRGAKVYLVAYIDNYFLHFIGPQTALEAVWAHLNTSEVRRTGRTNIGVSLEEGVRYKRIQQRLPSGLFDMVMVHPQALITNTEQDFFLICEEPTETPPDAFFDILNQRLRLPILKEWAGELWKKGLKAKHFWQNLIYERSGEGAFGYLVFASNTEAWEKIVKEIVNGKTGK